MSHYNEQREEALKEEQDWERASLEDLLTMYNGEEDIYMLSEDINQQAKRYNQGKPQLSLVDLTCLEPCAKILEFGLQKYGRNNWKKGSPISQLLDSLLRHISRLQAGEFIDSESGLPHIGHIQANALFLGNSKNTDDMTENHND